MKRTFPSTSRPAPPSATCDKPRVPVLVPHFLERQGGVFLDTSVPQVRSRSLGANLGSSLAPVHSRTTSGETGHAIASPFIREVPQAASFS
jgi:hypothetical protein